VNLGLAAFLTAFPALFSIVNPPGAAFIFNEVTAELSHAERASLARRVGLYSLLVMLGSLYGGAYVLGFFGISLGALRLAGGAVVAVALSAALTGQVHPWTVPKAALLGLVVAVVAGPSGRLAARFGFRRVLLAGFVVFVSGLVWYATRVGLRPDYVGIWLPATLITGLGIGLTFPVLSAAAVSSLHPERFAVGSAVNQTARQVGGAFGVALLVVILGAPTGAATALASFHHLWWYCAGMAALAGLLCALLAPNRRAGAVPADTRAGTTEAGTTGRGVPAVTAPSGRPA